MRDRESNRPGCTWVMSTAVCRSPDRHAQATVGLAKPTLGTEPPPPTGTPKGFHRSLCAPFKAGWSLVLAIQGGGRFAALPFAVVLYAKGVAPSAYSGRAANAQQIALRSPEFREEPDSLTYGAKQSSMCASPNGSEDEPFSGSETRRHDGGTSDGQ